MQYNFQKIKETEIKIAYDHNIFLNDDYLEDDNTMLMEFNKNNVNYYEMEINCN